VVRVLASHYSGPGLIPNGAICGMNLFLVLALPRGVFSGFSGFPLCTKINTPNSNSTKIEDPLENQFKFDVLLNFLLT